MDNSPDKESPDAVKQLRALADDKVAATCAYAPDLRRAAKEIENLRRTVERNRTFWLRAAKKALDGDTRDLANRVAMCEAEPMEIVLSSESGEP